MVKISTAVSSRKRKKRVLKLAKGQFGQRSKRYQQASRSVLRSLAYSYRDRKVRKQEFRTLWIIRLNAACREEGLSYSRFIKGLSNANVTINRKVLADLAVNEPDVFKKLIVLSKEAVNTASPAAAKTTKSRTSPASKKKTVKKSEK